MNTALLTAEELRAVLHYDPATGIFTRVADLRGYRGMLIAKAGDVAGGADELGYVRMRIAGRRYKAHRLAVLFMTGHWPTGEVDHIDHNPSNNAWSNLRDVPRDVNQQNQVKAAANNKIGRLGVHQARGKYIAQIRVNGTSKHIGSFDCPDAAHAAYIDAKRQLHAGCTI